MNIGELEKNLKARNKKAAAEGIRLRICFLPTRVK